MPARPPEQRCLLLAGQQLPYELRRSARRSIGLSIDQRGLRVAAPARASLTEIEKLIFQHQRWVLEKLAEWRERSPAPALEIADGKSFPLLGEPWLIALTAIGRRRWQFGPGVLYLNPGEPGQLAGIFEKALREKARQLFAERLGVHAARLGVPTPPLRLSSARTRWGSCNRQGDIALNWRLVFLALPLVDYVVCHELAHLKEMNHSPRFWSVVEQLCPDWALRRRELRELGRQIPLLQ